MTDRERLLKILNVPIHPHENVDPLEAVADYLLDNGITFKDKVDELERIIAQQRSRAQTAEDFVCKLCAECEWEENDGISTMIKKCCNWFPECKQFKIRSRWIPVTERLPEKYYETDEEFAGEPIEFIVFIKGALCATFLCFDGESFFDQSTGDRYAVTHWMPIPELPKEES